MDRSYLLLLCAAVVAMVSGQQQQSQCSARFVQSASACMQNASLSIQNVQYVASNGTSGSPPSENINNYRRRVCQVKPQLDVCGQTVTQRLINSTLCISQIEKQNILSSYKTTFGGLDSNCAQPCRYTLMDELRQCYSFVNIQPTLISDIALVKNAIIGQNWDQTYHFCRNRGQLLSCMQQKIMICPDAPRVLASYDLNIRSFERGLDMLCDNIGLYLAGIHCFKNPIPEVRTCFQTMERGMQNLRQIAPQPTADQISLGQFCSIRLQQIDCEMGAWSRHNYQTCERVVTGMRNELSCKLLPDMCRVAYPQLVTNLCNPLNYFAEDRWRYNKASVSGGGSLLGLLVLAMGVSAVWRV